MSHANKASSGAQKCHILDLVSERSPYQMKKWAMNLFLHHISCAACNMEIHVDVTTTTDIEVYGDHILGEQTSSMWLDGSLNASDQGHHAGGSMMNADQGL
jgi:hypothetical protein